MSLEGLSDDQILALEKQLLAKLRELGSTSGNVSLMRVLGWGDERYWSVRDRLVDSGDLTLGRGRGGSVRIVDGEEPVDAPEPIPLAPQEAALYAPMSQVIRNHWAKDQRFGRVLVEATARQGRRDTGGTWTRPDITVAAMTTHVFVPGKHFEVVTFEVKTWNGLNVTAVYEALAHSRAATRSYVLVHVPEATMNEDGSQELLAKVEDEAKRHGIGLIVANDPSDYSTWLERVGASFDPPAAQALNDLISLQFSDGAKQELLAWMR